MLGLLKSKNSWIWAGCGKHPAAKDYFRFQVESSLMTAFGDWVEKGFRVFNAGRKNGYGKSSWCFWSRGVKPGELLCGVLKDSSDSIGRPFPLLVMGIGSVKGWEKRWALLLHGLKDSWGRIEQIASMRFEHVEQLEKEVHRLSPPIEGGLDGMHIEPVDPLEEQNVSVKAVQLKEHGELWLPLDDYRPMDPFTIAQAWCAALAKHGAEAPNALFMGGVPERHFLVLLRRSLNVGDFGRLWAMKPEGDL
jgi:type VI secretion system protein VasJ